jgi:FAD/FMN-containing dehydrogenase
MGPGPTTDRRQFLRRSGSVLAVAGVAALVPSLAGCGDTSASAPTTTTGAGPVPWADLARSLSGPLVRPGSPDYQTDKQLYNERFDVIDPAAIAYCQSPSDVQRSIAFARRYGVATTARSGGHSYGGYSLCPGLVVDTTSMATVTPSSGGQQAVVGAGARLIDIYGTLGQAGLLLPGGSCPTVGIAGLALGGGVGVFGRLHGLTSDNVASLTLVSADSRVLVCDPGHNADLYWACRGGGGGNFGVVTSFTFTVHPIPPLALFTLVYPWSAAADVLGAWQHWSPGTPDELWSNCQLLSSGSAGGSTPLTVRVTGVFAGTPGDLSGLLAPLLSAVGPAPTSQFVGPEAYLPAMLIEAGCEGSTVAQCHLPSQNPAGTQSRAAFAAKSAYVTQPMPQAGLTAVVDQVASLATELPAEGGGMVFDAYGGAINRVPADATAFVHRDAIAAIEYSVSWGGADPSVVPAGVTSWLDGASGALAPYTDGAYQNYIDPTLSDWQQAYYGANLDRLRSVKRAADPDDFFHFAQSIPPA